MKLNKKIKQKELTKRLLSHNSTEKNITKAIEELQELSLVLTQFINKPSRVKKSKITDEIGDVELRLPVLRSIFGSEAVDKRKEQKSVKLYRYLEEKLFKTI